MQKLITHVTHIMPETIMYYGKENPPLKVEEPIKNKEYKEREEEMNDDNQE